MTGHSLSDCAGRQFSGEKEGIGDDTIHVAVAGTGVSAGRDVTRAQSCHRGASLGHQWHPRRRHLCVVARFWHFPVGGADGQRIGCAALGPANVV